MMRSRGALLASTVLVVLVVLVDRRSTVGAVLVLWLLSVVPGSALSRLVRFPADGVAGWVIAIGASFSIDVLFTVAMVYVRVWTAARGLIVLCLVAVVLVVAERVVAHRHAPDEAAERQRP
jgi:hypothetical protein